MKDIIKGIMYDTHKSTLIFRNYYESLYCTRWGTFFAVGVQTETSDNPAVPVLTVLSPDCAFTWLQRRGQDELSFNIYPEARDADSFTECIVRSIRTLNLDEKIIEALISKDFIYLGDVAYNTENYIALSCGLDCAQMDALRAALKAIDLTFNIKFDWPGMRRALNRLIQTPLQLD